MGKFGEYIKQKRLKLRMSLRDVESKSGISNAYLSMIESGKRLAPHPNKLKRLASALDEKVEDLMKIAGYLDQTDQEAQETEINLEFDKVIRDPEFQFGHRMRGDLDTATKRFIVEMYKKLKRKRENG